MCICICISVSISVFVSISVSVSVSISVYVSVSVSVSISVSVSVSIYWHFSGGSDGKEFTCKAWNLGLISEWGRSPGEGNGNPLQYSYPVEFHGQRSLAGYSPRGCKEST